jgi:hypothetical protein
VLYRGRQWLHSSDQIVLSVEVGDLVGDGRACLSWLGDGSCGGLAEAGSYGNWLNWGDQCRRIERVSCDTMSGGG